MTKFKFKPMLYITLVNIVGFLMLFLFCEGDGIKYFTSCLVLCTINIIVYVMLYHLDFGDLYLFLTVSMLTSLGIIMLYSIDYNAFVRNISSSTGNYASTQLLWFIIGIVVYFVTMVFFGKIKIWDRLRYLYMLICVGLFLVTLVLGKEINGSRNWIVVGGISIQPSELVKIFYCLTLASYFSKIPPADSKLKDKRKRFMTIPLGEIVACVFTYFCMGCLVLFQNEWGTALLLFLIYFAMCFVYKTNNLLKLLNLAALVLAAIVGVLLMDHIAGRIESWRDPWSDPTGTGYNAVQALIAIYHGGYFGAGVGCGSPTIIPERHTDYIFAAICEEMGMLTGIGVILLYFILTYRGIKIAIKTKDTFLKAACLALVISIGFQTFIIIGGVINLIPLTGITLPFVSYGGSSMIVSFIMLGIITAVSFPDKKKKKSSK